jgi:hypothetical protein
MRQERRADLTKARLTKLVLEVSEESIPVPSDVLEHIQVRRAASVRLEGFLLLEEYKIEFLHSLSFARRAICNQISTLLVRDAVRAPVIEFLPLLRLNRRGYRCIRSRVV